jgi:hypothetical protein
MTTTTPGPGDQDSSAQPAPKRRVKRTAAPVEICELKVTLKGSKPAIWRRFAVPASIKLDKLHDVLQTVMGWCGDHLHEFIGMDDTRYGGTDPLGFELDSDAEDERKYRLRDLAPGAGFRFTYEYDFGDGWEHTVEVLKVGPPLPNMDHALCLAGKRACPPEDCGGIWGYRDLLRVLADPADAEHAEKLEWLGGAFDPERFDLDALNARLRHIRLNRT